MNLFLEEDVPDPTDFPPDTNAPGLRSLDEVLRCTICRELFEAPVTVNCSHGHCFCSLCIREQMNTKQECPLCRQTIAEVYIRRNPIVEDILGAWKLSRPFILKLLEERNSSPPATPPTHSVTLQSIPSSLSKRRRRMSSSSDDEIVELPGPSEMRQALQKSDVKITSSRTSSRKPMVQCPICRKEMTEDIINRHLDDNCKPLSTIRSPTPKKRKIQTQEWSRLFGNDSFANKGKARSKPLPELDIKEAESLPKMAYDTVTAKTIRERLSEYSLPTEGEKPALAARHLRWITMFNANLDASPSERKTLQQLRKELRKREENEGLQKRRKTRPHNVDVNVYEKDNKLAFAQLVEQARPKPPSQRPAVQASVCDDTSILDEVAVSDSTEIKRTSGSGVQ
ncbi:hypothetical protein BDY19DRAFT_920684 [Irpex rosettiformis]|uniref:Uncharacterized protein n=1 Tax=Irpex rosettiformis TaxID=378272 RepID=A0ACB8UK46_9APHY|nr:hypothetical protein BDY19DRAFT_920684 [Irpex rosettiformis]